jgi:hypothetical protein
MAIAVQYSNAALVMAGTFTVNLRDIYNLQLQFFASFSTFWRSAKNSAFIYTLSDLGFQKYFVVVLSSTFFYQKLLERLKIYNKCYY